MTIFLGSVVEVNTKKDQCLAEVDEFDEPKFIFQKENMGDDSFPRLKEGSRITWVHDKFDEATQCYQVKKVEWYKDQTPFVRPKEVYYNERIIKCLKPDDLSAQVFKECEKQIQEKLDNFTFTSDRVEFNEYKHETQTAQKDVQQEICCTFKEKKQFIDIHEDEFGIRKVREIHYESKIGKEKTDQKYMTVQEKTPDDEGRKAQDGVLNDFNDYLKDITFKTTDLKFVSQLKDEVNGGTYFYLRTMYKGDYKNLKVRQVKEDKYEIVDQDIQMPYGQIVNNMEQFSDSTSSKVFNQIIDKQNYQLKETDFKEDDVTFCSQLIKVKNDLKKYWLRTLQKEKFQCLKVKEQKDGKYEIHKWDVKMPDGVKMYNDNLEKM